MFKGIYEGIIHARMVKRLKTAKVSEEPLETPIVIEELSEGCDELEGLFSKVLSKIEEIIQLRVENGVEPTKDYSVIAIDNYGSWVEEGCIGYMDLIKVPYIQSFLKDTSIFRTGKVRIFHLDCIGSNFINSSYANIKQMSEVDIRGIKPGLYGLFQ